MPGSENPTAALYNSSYLENFKIIEGLFAEFIVAPT